jgi:tetratricopeptide (TPR) repeat protein
MNPRWHVLIGMVLLVGLWSHRVSARSDLEISEPIEDIYAVTDGVSGEAQLFLASDRGLVAINSFASPATAERFKQAIAEHLDRRDFCYVIDLVDRIDLFRGNGAYGNVPVIAQRAFWDKYKGHPDVVEAELDELSRMWREKAKGSRERLASKQSGSEEAANERRWLELCTARAEELESKVPLLLPTEVYKDRKIIDLGNFHLDLIWFGRTNYSGMTIVTIPEKKLAIVPGFILHDQHLAPSPGPRFYRFDVPRWIAVLKEVLEGNNAVDHVLCGTHNTDLWSRDRAAAHLHYIRTLWNDVERDEAVGLDLPEIQNRCSLDGKYAFVKDMEVYRNHGDAWVRPQHRSHVRLFFLQHKNPAVALIEAAQPSNLSATLDRIRQQIASGEDIYVEEMGINALGYRFLSEGKCHEAADIFKLNVDTHPESANVYDSYAEALMKCGDTENAIRNCKRSLELNPDNEHSRNMLKLLEND